MKILRVWAADISRVLMVFGILTVAGLSVPAIAQAAPVGPGNAAGAADTTAPGAAGTAAQTSAGVTALQSQLAALEARIAKLEAAANKPQTLVAPLTVVDGAGKPIFAVSSTGGTSDVRIVGAAGSLALSAGNDLEFSATGASSSAVLNVAGGQSTLKLGNSGGNVLLGEGGAGPTLSVTQGSEQIFSVGTAGDGAALTVKKNGKAVSLSTQSGKIGVNVLNADYEYLMGEQSNIRGFAAYRNGLPLGGIGALASDQFRVVIYNGTKPVFLGGYDPTGKLGMFLSDDSGKPIASIEQTDGGGTLTLGQTGANVVLKAASGEASLVAKVDQRQTIMGVNQASTGFVVADQGKPLIGLGDKGDRKPSLGIFGEGSSPVLTAGYMSGGKVGLRVGDATRPLALLSATDGSGSLDLYGPSGGAPMISLTSPGGANPQIQIMSAGGQAAFLAGAKSDGSGGSVKVLAKGQLVGGIESLSDGTGNVYVADGGKNVAEMRGGKNRFIAVYGDSAKAVVQMGMGESGGGTFIGATPSGEDVFTAGYEPSSGMGRACVARKGTKCLGVGLTGMEGFH